MFDGYLLVIKYATAKISHKWRFIAGEIIYNWRVFQQAMLDYRRVREQAQSISCLVNSGLTLTIVD
jgi:hypothetical protein